MSFAQNTHELGNAVVSIDTNNSKKLTVFNLIMTFSIVIYHWKNFYELNCLKTVSPTVMDSIFYLLNTLGCMALNYFFFISGFLLYFGMKDKAACLRKLKSRLYSLGVPFLVWNALVLIWKIVYSLATDRRLLHFTFPELLLGFSFDAFCGQLWYLLALIFMLPLAYFICKIRTKRFLTVVLLSIIGTGAYIASKTIHSDAGLIAEWFSRFFNYVPIYLMGALCGLYLPQLVLCTPKSKAVIAACSVILPICYVYVSFDPLHIPVLSYLISFFIPVSLWMIIPAKAMDKLVMKFPWKISFFIYAMHVVLISLMNTALHRLIEYNSLPIVFVLVLHTCFIAALYGICLLFAYLCKKVLPPKLFSMLTGGRT